MNYLKYVPWLGAAAMWAVAAQMWDRVPAELPVHWNFSGQPDRWGGRAEALLLLPGVVTVALAAFSVLPRIDPGRANWDQMRGAWAGFQVAFVVLLGAIYAATLGTFDMATMMPRLLGAFLIVLGALMGKVRPNFFFGVRTPWTLTSKRAWIRTHRVGGFAYIAVGILGIVLGFVAPGLAFGALLAGLLAVSLGLVAYSWAVWRGDPDRGGPA